MQKLYEELFVCELCHTKYAKEQDALNCESKPITQDKEIKIGDEILITNGDGKDDLAIVESIVVLDKYYGHYAWKKYWHTIALTAKLKNGTGHRFLVYDHYEKI